MLPARTDSPPNDFTPRRRPAESRPLRDEPPAFLWAMISLRRYLLPRFCDEITSLLFAFALGRRRLGSVRLLRRLGGLLGRRLGGLRLGRRLGGDGRRGCFRRFRRSRLGGRRLTGRLGRPGSGLRPLDPGGLAPVGEDLG